MSDQPFNATAVVKSDDDADDGPFNHTAPADIAASSLAEDATGLTPETLDLASWLRGVTPIRETVTIYPDGNAQAEISKLAQLETTAPKAEREKITKRLTELYTERVASGMDFVVEGRTGTWVATFIAEAKESGVTDLLEVTLRQIAAQIVEPAGVTHEHLRSIYDANRDAEINRLAEALYKANNAKLGIDPRFLLAASD